MSLFDDIMPEVAETLLDTGLAGTQCTFKVYSGGSYNPLTGVDTSTSNTSASINCSPPQDYKQKDIDGANIIQGDMFIYVSQPDWVKLDNVFQPKPTNNMSVVIRGKEYAVIEVYALSSGDIESAWEVQLRSA